MNECVARQAAAKDVFEVANRHAAQYIRRRGSRGAAARAALARSSEGGSPGPFDGEEDEGVAGGGGVGDGGGRVDGESGFDSDDEGHADDEDEREDEDEDEEDSDDEDAGVVPKGWEDDEDGVG